MTKTILISSLLLSIGCVTENKGKIIDEIIPEVAKKSAKDDGSKGKFPPGRIINYKGHGVNYTTGNGHINHHKHHNHYHEHGGNGYHND